MLNHKSVYRKFLLWVFFKKIAAFGIVSDQLVITRFTLSCSYPILKD